MTLKPAEFVPTQVALRKESVDRNYPPGPPSFLSGVSLSARRAWIEIIEADKICKPPVKVALRKESVDRNPYVPLAKVRHCEVALRKESVDRNRGHGVWPRRSVWSLSARRAWIEIWASGPRATGAGSLSARRAWIEILYTSATVSWVPCRSPQGERG